MLSYGLTGSGVLQLEVLVLELVAVDGLAPGAVVRGEVTTLEKYRGRSPKTFSIGFSAGLSPILVKISVNCLNW